ncbi:MAG: PEGA domain-containing protein [Treponema sp.]|nr:PEGA domain-containing protein [Treponema sp.]
MKKAQVCFILLSFLLFLPAPLLASPSSVITGETFIETLGRGLEIATEPNGVRVFIDGVERGLTPFVNNDLLPGDYSIRLVRENYEERSFEVTLHSNSRLFMLIEMIRIQGNANVTIHREEGASYESTSQGSSAVQLPFAPQLFSRSLGSAPIPLSDNKTTIRLSAGFHTFTARAFGWEETTVTVLISETENIQVDIYMKPAAFKIENFTQSRRRLNPYNSGNLGITEYRFEATAPGSGIITITNNSGSAVYTKQLEINSRVQQIQWNGRDAEGSPLPQGTYTAVIEAQGLSIKQETEINYSYSIFAQPLESGTAGLVFAPMPHVLPKGSYQFDAGIIYCSALEGFPFKINMRMSFLDRLELTASFNMSPNIQNQTGWGITGSAMYNFYSGAEIGAGVGAGGSLPLVFSAALSYSWSSNNGEYPLSPGRGAGFYLPLSYEIKNSFFEQFSIVLCPSLYFNFGSIEDLTNNLTPEFHISAGIFVLNNWYSAGLSARYELNFNDASQNRFLAGAQAAFFPPPSNLFFSLQAGIRIHHSLIKGYGGVGIGIIY